MEGLTWLFLYNSSDEADESWAYGFPIAPLAADLVAYLRLSKRLREPGIGKPPCLPQLLLHVLMTPVQLNHYIYPSLRAFHERYGAKLCDGDVALKVCGVDVWMGWWG